MSYCPHFGQAFTVRGQCATCAPDIHANYHRAYSATSEMMARFEQETGTSALGNWSAFEAFVDVQSDKAEYFEALASDSRSEAELQVERGEAVTKRLEGR